MILEQFPELNIQMYDLDDDPALLLQTWRERIMRLYELRANKQVDVMFKRTIQIINQPLIEQTSTTTMLVNTLKYRTLSPNDVSPDVEREAALSDFASNLRVFDFNPDRTYTLWGDIRGRSAYPFGYDEAPFLWDSEMLYDVVRAFRDSNRYISEAYKGLKYGFPSGAYPAQKFGTLRHLTLSYSREPSSYALGTCGAWMAAMGFPSYTVEGSLTVVPSVSSRIQLHQWVLPFPSALRSGNSVVLSLRLPGPVSLNKKRGAESRPTTAQDKGMNVIPSAAISNTTVNPKRKKARGSRGGKRAGRPGVGNGTAVVVGANKTSEPTSSSSSV